MSRGLRTEEAGTHIFFKKNQKMIFKNQSKHMSNKENDVTESTEEELLELLAKKLFHEYVGMRTGVMTAVR